ncbi:MAG: DUF3291 domain-containing protein [Pseudomonadota bacterium]
MTGRHLAQINIGRLVAPVDDPRVREFMDNLDRVNGVAERLPGYVWRLQSDIGNATDLPLSAEDPQFISNISVWEDIASFEQFVWNTVHRQFYERKHEWFEAVTDQHFAMWWVPIGHRPTQEEGMDRLALLRERGDSDQAFGWSYLAEARLWRTRNCSHLAAE